MKNSQYILVRSSQPENRYGPYLREVLKFEGFNGFETRDLDSFDLRDLKECDLVILTRCFLKNSEIEILLESVKNGTSLACIQPSPELPEALGLKNLYKVIHPGYVKIKANCPGPDLPIQTHVPITLYEPGDNSCLEVVATATGRDWEATPYPAAARLKIGKGQVACFFYDLPKAIARLRFGNPELASHLTTGHFSWLHTFDQFYGHLDTRLAHLPQAEYHSQLLAKLLTELSQSPLPRLWYYPQPQEKTAVIFTSDGDNSTPEQFNRISSALRDHDGTATFYLMKTTKLDEKSVADYRTHGFTFSPHINPRNSEDVYYFDFVNVIKEETKLFRKRFGDHDGTLQCHCAPWQGHMSWVPDFAQAGFKMLMAYMSFTPATVNQFLCGGSRPIRFADENGDVLDCWQQPILTYDDTTMIETLGKDPGKPLRVFEKMLLKCRQETHSVWGILSHPCSFDEYSGPYFTSCMDLMVKYEVNIYNGCQWLEFQKTRDETVVKHEVSANGTVSITVGNLAGPVTLMVPTKGRDFRTTLNGRTIDVMKDTRLKEEYVLIKVEKQDAQKDISIICELEEPS